MRGFNLDKKTLSALYLDQKKSCKSIGELYGVGFEAIRKNLIRCDIPRRSAASYKIRDRLVLKPEQLEFLDGFLAGDGSISYRLARDTCNGWLSGMFKHKEFAKYISNYLDIDKNVSKYIHKSERYKSGECICYTVHSGANVFYTEERGRWYPNGVKIIPSDFSFSPTSMNILYLCDGSKLRLGAVICTDSFEIDNVEATIITFLRDIGIKCHVRKDSKVYISEKSIRDFLNFIGDCPVKCYNYKWRIK